MSRLLLLPAYQPGNVPSQPSAGQVIVALGSGNRVKGVTQGRLAASAIPFIWAPTGTMANNGAITLGTALSTTYANAYVLLPVSAIFAGSAAGWYFAQFSSATLGTVFNNSYVSNAPSIPTSPVAFVTTGPGAYTGVTSAANGPQITVPAGVMGLNGVLRVALLGSCANSAGNKTFNVFLGVGTFLNTIATTVASINSSCVIYNRGAANSQVAFAPGNSSGFGTAAGVSTYGGVNTAVNQTLSVGGTLAVATDFLVIEAFVAEVLPG